MNRLAGCRTPGLEVTKHSETESFDFQFEGEVHSCSFFITDDRLITATAAGQRRTVALGSTPPLALAESIWTEMLRSAGKPKPAEPHDQEQHENHEHRVEKLFGLLIKAPARSWRSCRSKIAD
jgi:hypothetical protein